MEEEKSRLLKLFKIDKLIEHLVGYVDTKIALTKLEFEEKLKDIITNGFHYAIIVVLSAMLLFFLNIGLANLLNEIFSSNYYGFIIVSFFYLIFVLVFIFDKKKIVSNKISNKIFNKKDSE